MVLTVACLHAYTTGSYGVSLSRSGRAAAVALPRHPPVVAAPAPSLLEDAPPSNSRAQPLPAARLSVQRRHGPTLGEEETRWLRSAPPLAPNLAQEWTMAMMQTCQSCAAHRCIQTLRHRYRLGRQHQKGDDPRLASDDRDRTARLTGAFGAPMPTPQCSSAPLSLPSFLPPVYPSFGCDVSADTVGQRDLTGRILLSWRRAARGESTPELAADARQMREEIASLKGMWQQLETAADGSKDTAAAAAAAITGPDEDDYW